MYTRQEVARLKGLGEGTCAGGSGCECGRCEARYLSEGWRDSLLQGQGGTAAEETLPLVARWWDVKRAMDSLVLEKRTREVMALRTQGYAEQDIARITGLDRSMVRRRFEATMLELMAALGGEYVEPPRVSSPAKCLVCGVGERVYLVPTRASRWACIGWRRDEDGRLCQAWQCRAVVMLRRRPLVGSAQVGHVFRLKWTVQRGDRRKVIGTTELPGEHFPPGHPWVLGWERDTRAAEDGRPVPERTWRVPSDDDEAEPGRQSAVCADCLAPSLRRRVEQSRRAGRQ